MDFFIEDTNPDRVEALIDVLLEALAFAPLEYSVDDCAAALVGALREILTGDGPPSVH